MLTIWRERQGDGGFVLQEDRGHDIKQECPQATDTYFLPMIETPIKMTICAMDSEEYCMMLLPEEY